MLFVAPCSVCVWFVVRCVSLVGYWLLLVVCVVLCGVCRLVVDCWFVVVCGLVSIGVRVLLVVVCCLLFDV